VAIGMLARHIAPGLARFERVLSLGFATALVLVAVGDFSDRPDVSLELFALSLWPAVALTAAALGVGFSVSRLAGQTAADAVTIAVELCVKNALLGIVVVSTAFETLEPSIPLFVYSGVMIPAAILVLAIHRMHARRSANAEEEAAQPG